jgi:hypothetical protein
MRIAYLEKIAARRMSVLCNLRDTDAVQPVGWAGVGPNRAGGAVRENWLESESEASAAGTKLRRQKERHGYRAF